MPRATVPIVYARCGSDNGGGSDLEAQLSTYGPKYVIIIWGNFLCLIY